MSRKETNGPRDSENENEVPEGWVAASLKDVVAEVQPGFACGVNNREGDGIAHLRPMNINVEGEIDLTDLKYVPEENVDSPRKWLSKGDVLFNNTNSTELVGKSAYYGHDEPRAFSNHMTRVRVHGDAFNAKYCAAYLHHCWRRGHFQEVCNQHVSQSSVGGSVLLDTSVPVPPLPEQSRIVAKVEALLERVNKARERLDRVPEILNRFRQSVLAAACSGRLTADWRKDEECGDELPRSWKRRSLSLVCSGFEYGSSQKSESEGKIPVLRMGNIQAGEIDWSDLKFTSDREEIKKYGLQPNTVLFNRTNSPELVGKTAIYRGARPAAFAGYLIRIHHGPEVDPEYLNYCLNASEFREYCSQVKSDGVSQSNINAQKLAAYEMPWCPIEEQTEIVRRLKGLLGGLGNVVQSLANGRLRAERIIQSILGKAFAGELVETEAEFARREGLDYEPAWVLLERVKLEQTADKGTSKNGKDKKMAKGKAASELRALTDVLAGAKGGLTPEQLLHKAGFDESNVEQFFRELREGVRNGDIIEKRPNKADVRLTAKR